MTKPKREFQCHTFEFFLTFFSWNLEVTKDFGCSKRKLPSNFIRNGRDLGPCISNAYY